jgi:two-component system nitrogen regulation response regulator GlnG
MAPSQVIEPKDLPPEVQGSSMNAYHAEVVPQLVAHPEPVIAARPESVEGAPFTSIPQAHLERDMTSNGNNWELGMAKVAKELLATERTDVWDEMTRRFESHLIQAALISTKGRRVDAAHKLGIGRNTITRKIQELGLDKE